MLEKLFDNSLINDILEALSNNGEYSFDQNGLKINASKKDGNLHFSCSYTEDNSEQAKKNCAENRERFYNYCQSIDSDLFVETCESLNLPEVTAMVESDDRMDEGISVFMNALKEVAKQKVIECSNEIILLEEKIKDLEDRKNVYSKYTV